MWFPAGFHCDADTPALVDQSQDSSTTFEVLKEKSLLVQFNQTHTRPPKTPGGSFLRLVQEGLVGLGVS